MPDRNYITRRRPELLAFPGNCTQSWLAKACRGCRGLIGPSGCALNLVWDLHPGAQSLSSHHSQHLKSRKIGIDLLPLACAAQHCRSQPAAARHKLKNWSYLWNGNRPAPAQEEPLRSTSSWHQRACSSLHFCLRVSCRSISVAPHFLRIGRRLRRSYQLLRYERLLLASRSQYLVILRLSYAEIVNYAVPPRLTFIDNEYNEALLKVRMSHCFWVLGRLIDLLFSSAPL